MIVYTVKPFDSLSWIIDKETDDDITSSIVNFNPFLDKFVCDCTWNVVTERECKHIRMVKQYIVRGVDRFDE